MKKLLLLAPFAVLFACGDGAPKEEEVEKLKLDEFNDRLSYAFGAKNAESILSNDPKFQKLDKAQLLAGFESNLSNQDASDCQQTMMSLFGPYGQDFDTTYIVEGSKCIGRLSANSLYSQMDKFGEVSRLNLELVKKGFKHGLYDQDTVNLSESDQQKVMDQFFGDLEAKMTKKMEEDAKVFWDKVKSNPAAKQIGTTGIYLETLQKGTGGSPTATSDVEAHYTLTNALGEKMESSLDMGQPLKISLQGVIAGWTEGFPSMKKGGKYKLYVPAEKAYGPSKGPLCFEIELINFGAAGTIAPPPQQAPAGY